MSFYEETDIAVIGGGIIGCATALAILEKHDCRLKVVEAEDHLAPHQSGHNSGVIHSGIYYRPGSLKARLCAKGREAMYSFCRKHGIRHERCGKVIVATSEEELPRLDDLEKRGRDNGLDQIERLDRKRIAELEPHIRSIDGLFVPYTGIVDYVDVVNKYAELIRAKGGLIRTSAKVRHIARVKGKLVLYGDAKEIRTNYLINCGGLYSDRVARLAGIKPSIQIIPFRGEYYELAENKRQLIKNLVYPVPDPRFPFLGVHFTRSVYNEVEAGPNAVLAFSREGYKKTDISFLETANMALSSGFWKMARRYLKTGIGEFYRSLSKSAFSKELKRLLPQIESDDLTPGGAGVRAQALDSEGNLIDDFKIDEAENMIHVLNAPSPAATASLAIGEYIADLAEKKFLT